jgi:hypothetical protein
MSRRPSESGPSSLSVPIAGFNITNIPFNDHVSAYGVFLSGHLTVEVARTFELMESLGSGATAVDVKDMAGDERRFVRRNEDDRVGSLLG